MHASVVQAEAAAASVGGTWVKQNQAIAPNEVEPAAASLAAEQEHKLVVLGVVELLHQLLTLVDACAAIQTHKRILQQR